MGQNSEILDLEWALGDGPFSLQGDNWPNISAYYVEQPVSNIDFQPNVSVPEQKKPKRVRTIFTPYQLAGLEKEFRMRKYLDRIRRSQMAYNLGLTDRQIKVWFQNRRMKEKRNVSNPETVPQMPAEQMSMPPISDFQYFLPQQAPQPNYFPQNYMIPKEWNQSY